MSLSMAPEFVCFSEGRCSRLRIMFGMRCRFVMPSFGIRSKTRLLVFVGAVAGCNGAAEHARPTTTDAPATDPSAVSTTPTHTPTRHSTEAANTDLALGAVRQILSTNWCDRGPRTGRLVWDAVPDAARYEVDLVATHTCCDYEYASWPDDRWEEGRRVIVTDAMTSDEAVDSTYFRIRAVASDGRAGPWTHGMWECWVE